VDVAGRPFPVAIKYLAVGRGIVAEVTSATSSGGVAEVTSATSSGD